MTKWTKEELDTISKDGNLYLTIPNEDGSLHAPAWIWIAESEGRLFSRGYNGTSARWYQSAKREGKGHISVGGVEKDVAIQFPTDERLNEKIDEGYKRKYSGSQYLSHMISQKAREATVEFMPKN